MDVGDLVPNGIQYSDRPAHYEHLYSFNNLGKIKILSNMIITVPQVAQYID